MTTSDQVPGAIQPILTRRGLIIGGFAAASVLTLSPPGRLSPAAATTSGGALPLVQELATPSDRTAFDPVEQVLADYLVIVAAMANDIVTDGGPMHGWMSGGWWRTPS
ncbi:hypothetical protein NFC73_15095 [Pseudarthrobacter sp. RMG13]|uniref:Uncharacterized protein n=1 Tax=Pseudarthrobacter humi TaxID=2952523 RepID=A0ABT1LSC9_9MICC|nr:hypothetical protein [Pseudarthrobacter humi]MCP9001039.1 hypothetical protein [Pseudarthrobacter humi]